MTAARKACWQYLEKNGSSTAVGDREDLALRALLCVLEPHPRNDISDTAEWFSAMLQRLGADWGYLRVMVSTDGSSEVVRPAAEGAMPAAMSRAPATQAVPRIGAAHARTDALKRWPTSTLPALSKPAVLACAEAGTVQRHRHPRSAPRGR
jgi:hypothetical protein